MHVDSFLILGLGVRRNEFLVSVSPRLKSVFALGADALLLSV